MQAALLEPAEACQGAGFMGPEGAQEWDQWRGGAFPGLEDTQTQAVISADSPHVEGTTVTYSL